MIRPAPMADGTLAARKSCAMCGALYEPAEYHPHAYCVLVKAMGSTAARANLYAVLDYGRMLERTKLPNDAPITAPALRARDAGGA